MGTMKSEPELYKPAEACRIAEVAPYVPKSREIPYRVIPE